MRRIIITGANSFIGKRLCRKLVEQGDYIYAVVRNIESSKKTIGDIKNIEYICLNMDEYDRIDEVVSYPCDMGIMLAWNGTRGGLRQDDRLQKGNYINSVKCFEAMCRLGCKGIMTAGSQAEYGSYRGNKKTFEDDACIPETAYGVYKLKLYQHLQDNCIKDMRIIEPRFFSLYGDDDNDNTMVISIIKKMLKNEPCDLTLCTQLWDFLYVDDAVDILVKLLYRNNMDGVFNLGFGDAKPLRTYVELMYELTNSKSKLNFGKISYPASGIVHTNPSVNKLKEKLDWSPSISFEEGIKKVIEYQRKIEKEDEALICD